MQAVQEGKLPAALSLIDERHAELVEMRLHLERTLAALGTLAAQPAPLARTRYLDIYLPRPLRVGEAAQQVGVRVSAIHFWEQQGLLHPIREASSRYRLYDDRQMLRLRIIVLLREAGYNFETIRTTLNELAAGQPTRAIAQVEKRRAELARVSLATLAAAAMFHAYITEYWPDLCSSL